MNEHADHDEHRILVTIHGVRLLPDMSVTVDVETVRLSDRHSTRDSMPLSDPTLPLGVGIPNLVIGLIRTWHWAIPQQATVLVGDVSEDIVPDDLRDHDHLQALVVAHPDPTLVN